MSDSLEHYGRLGMKWYQHKFGAEDGRAMYTKKNEARYSKDKQALLERKTARYDKKLSKLKTQTWRP